MNYRNDKKNRRSLVAGEPTKPKTRNYCEVTKKSIELGEIGYTFVKHFPGYGYFTGTVVSIRPNARKCSCSSFISCMCCIQKLYMN